MRLPIRRVQPAFAALLTIALASCSGGAGTPSVAGGGAAPPLSPGQSAIADSLSPVVISPGAVNGWDNRFYPNDGDNLKGGQGQDVDGLLCRPSMVINEYHVHVYLGIVVDKRLIAIPDGLGMKDPGPDEHGYVNSAACYYSIHTHDASGMIHLEVNKEIPPSATFYKLKNFLDVWGIARDASNFGPFSGPIHVYVGNVPLKQTTVSKYTPYTGSYEDIALRSHEAIWIEIGDQYYTAPQLPSVTFYTEY